MYMYYNSQSNLQIQRSALLDDVMYVAAGDFKLYHLYLGIL